VPDDDPLMQVVTAGADPDARAAIEIDPLIGDGPRRISDADGQDVQPEVAEPEAVAALEPDPLGADAEADAEAVAKSIALLEQGDVDGAFALLKRLDGETQRSVLESLEGQPLPPESAAFVNDRLDVLDGFGAGAPVADDVILGADDSAPDLGADADTTDQPVQSDPLPDVADPTPRDPDPEPERSDAASADPDPTTPVPNVGGADFFGDDVILGDAGAPTPAPNAGGADFFGPEAGEPSAPSTPPSQGGLTPEEQLELERIALEGGDAIIDNIG
jgi:hypothetical protein